MNLSEVNYVLLYKLIYARLLKIYGESVSPWVENHRTITFDAMKIKMEPASSSNAAGLSSNESD